MKTSFISRLAVSVAIASVSISAAVAQPASTATRHTFTYTDVTTEVRKLDEPFLRRGAAVPVERVNRIQPNVTARQVIALLGNPVSTSDGANGIEWEYHLSLPLDVKGTDRIVCQYKVLFNAQGLVTDTAWRRKQCDAAARG